MITAGGDRVYRSKVQYRRAPKKLIECERLGQIIIRTAIELVEPILVSLGDFSPNEQ
jgi:hypothetical protein